MELVKTISVGEILVGVGTILLALFTLSLALITFFMIREDRKIRKEEIQRARRLRLLENVVKWLIQIFETIHVEVVTSRTTPTEDEIYEGKCNLLNQLLLLHRLGSYYLLECEQSFNEYNFKETANKYNDSYGKYTEKLHDAMKTKVPRSFLKDSADYGIEFENATNDFFQYIIKIRERENL